MAKHDIVTYNPTTQGFETDLGDNNAEIKGTGTKIFSVESGSTSVFSVGIDNTSINLNSNLTASGDISSSALSTGSFGRVVFTKISGDASQLTNVNEVGHVSGAAQVAARISGAFDAGFGVSGSISGSATSTGSFAKVFANTYVGDASQMTNVNEEGHFSGSAQLASDISGSFNKGFTYEGTISGSAQSTGSFGRVTWDGQITGNASAVTNLNEAGFVSSSAQLAANISGAFQHGFIIDGTISGSMTSTASFHTVNASTYVVTNKPNLNTELENVTGLITSSAQLAADISQSFNKGFEFTGTISGSATSTGSFSRLVATKFAGNASQITDLTFPTGMLSSSAQIAADISGSFTSGFGYTGTISGSATSTGSFARVVADNLQGDFTSISASEDGYVSSSTQIASEISASFKNRIIFGTPYYTGSWFIGVSGSKFGHVPDGTLVTGGETTMSISSLCGSDHDPRLQYDPKWTNTNTLGGFKTLYIGANPYSGAGGGVSAWSLGGTLPAAVTHGMHMGMANAALAAGGYNPSNAATTCKYDGAVWAASANLAEVRVNAATAGTQNAALIFSGRVTHPAEPSTDRTEQYNGSTWSEENNMSVAANGVGGLGTQNAAVAAGPMGSPATAQAEEFNGNVWSEVASHNDNRSEFAMGGTYYGGMMVLGSPTLQCSELWNGSTWAVTATVPSGTKASAFMGTSNAGMFYGNHAQTGQGKGHWDGTSWKSGPYMPVGTGYSGKTQPGIQSCALYVGGQQTANPATVKLDCTQHFEIIPANTGSFKGVFANSYKVTCFSGVTLTFANASKTLSELAPEISGAFNRGFGFTGKISGSATSTGSFSNFKADTIVTSDMTVGSFTDTNLMPYQSSSFRSHTNKPYIIPYVGDKFYDTRQYLQTGSYFSCGSCTEFSTGYDNVGGQLSIGRDGILNISFITSSGVNNDGNGITPGAWSAGPNMITGTRGHNSGTQNAAVVATGNTTTGEGPTTSHVQHYNGISWRRGADVIEAKGAVGGGQGYGKSEDDIGLLNSYTTGPKTKHLQYNGHSWWYMSKLLTSRRNQGSAGTQNSALVWGGDASPQALTEEWNGHSWSESGDLNTGKSARVGAGTQNAAIAGGGANTSQTELYDGTNWSTSNSVPYPSYCTAGMGGGQNDALAKGDDTAATWDGISWRTVADMSTVRNKADVSGNSALGLVAGGGTANSGTANSLDTVELWSNSFNTGSYLLTKKIGSNFS
jgi:hypothetical protein